MAISNTNSKYIKITLGFLFLLNFCATITARTVQPFNDNWLFIKSAMPDSILYSPTLGDWQSVTIPHTWNNVDMQTVKNNYYAGDACYKKEFRPDVSLQDKRIFLRFEGVASVTEVYINKKLAGNHKGAFSAFVLEITPFLKFGETNQIVVKVNNAPRLDVIPVNNTLFGVYGGMYRPVQLIITEKVNITVTDNASPGIYIRQKNVSTTEADVNIKVKIENKDKAAKELRLVSTIFEQDGKVKTYQEIPITVFPQGRQIVEQTITVKNPHLWQGLEDPYLYKVVTRLVSDNKVIDEIIQPLGLRHYELKAGDGMYLNGKKVPMYGVCRHQDWWQLGSALTNEQHDTDIAIIKELGATTIRLAHYQQSEYFYSKCDSIGLMVWAEIPFVNQVTTKESENTKQQLTELIRQNYNHPSIYIWGLHNEVYNPANYTSALTSELNDIAKSEDPDRYTVSVNGFGEPGHKVNMNADVQGINRYFGWYEKTIQDIEPWIENLEKNYPNYKIMLAEYGAEANIDQQQEVAGDVGDCCGFENNYNETFATRFHEIQWGYISKHNYLLASYLWNTFDFATPASSQGGVQARNMKGLVTFDRRIKKDPFYWYKANWSKLPVLYITQRRVVDRSNKITPVTVYSNIGVPRLYVNGVEYKNYLKGTTRVHYIFENIPLKKGKNLVEVKGVFNGKSYQDKIEWHYSELNKNLQKNLNPTEKKDEHTGL
ncbi:MAG: beta-galactosidase [Bacteroidetes bacterium]|nr:beta-galactosidase [Bacteroidota bacterium]